MPHACRSSRSGLLALLLLTACGDPTGPGQDIGAITLSAPATEIEIGASIQLAAMVLDRHGAVAAGHTVTWRSSHTGVATVSDAGRVTGHGPGAAVVRASAGAHSDSVIIRVRSGECAPAAATGSIALGESRTGELSGSDCLYYGNHAQGWRLELTSSAWVRIDLESSRFDAFLVVTDEHMNVLEVDDDGGDGLNSRLIREFAAGSYILWARTFAPGETGSYALTVQESEPPVSCSEPVGQVAVGDTVSGALTDASCVTEGRRADPWTLELSTAAALRIDLTSEQFDAFLFVTDTTGAWIGADDDGGEGFDARLDIHLQPGTYTLWATTYWAGEGGEYELTVRALEGAGAVAGAALHALPFDRLSAESLSAKVPAQAGQGGAAGRRKGSP